MAKATPDTFVAGFYRAAATKLHDNLYRQAREPIHFISFGDTYPEEALSLERALFEIAPEVRDNVRVLAVLQKVDLIENFVQVLSRLQLDDLDGAY